VVRWLTEKWCQVFRDVHGSPLLSALQTCEIIIPRARSATFLLTPLEQIIAADFESARACMDRRGWYGVTLARTSK
jgi:hypothetical protein